MVQMLRQSSAPGMLKQWLVEAGIGRLFGCDMVDEREESVG